MKFDLFESGLQNMRQIAKDYHEAIIYYHIDLDGVTSAISAKEYLAQYGIKTIQCEPIQYGSREFAVSKPENQGILTVLVDFAHGKSYMKIHTDHHDKQIEYDNTSKHFRHSKSNAGTISNIISTANIFPTEDSRIIDMVDSAGYKDEGINPWDMLRATLKTDKSQSSWKNHLQMGMIVNKLLLAYKNKPDFLNTIVMKSNPSLMSMYTNILSIIKGHIANGDKGWVSPEVIDKHSQEYYDSQSERKIPDMKVEDIKGMTNGQSGIIGDTIIQLGGGKLSKIGGFDRYTAFRLYPDSKYFIMLWHTIGMMQVSKNPWGKEQDDIHLGELVIDKIFKRKYFPLLMKERYNIPLLVIKRAFEKDINEENELKASGFDFEEFKAQFSKQLSRLNMTHKQLYLLQKAMDMKPSDFKYNGEEKHDEMIDKALSILKHLYIPLPELIINQSGGHPAITNLSGFNFLDEKDHTDLDGNPYDNSRDEDITNDEENKEPSKKKIFRRGDSTSTKILKSIAEDVVKSLNGQSIWNRNKFKKGSK